MSYWATAGVGQYVASQGHSGIADRLYKPDGTKRAVLFHTGQNNSAFDYLGNAVSGAQVTKPVADGLPVISFSLASTELFGNATNITRIGQLWSFMQTRFGVASDKFYGIGTSKGATGLLNYAKANPTKVAGLALLVPGVDLLDVYDNDRGGNASAIAACYGGGAPTAADNPADNTASFTGIPSKVWYSTDDTVCLPGLSTAFASAVGADTVSLGANGHSASTVVGSEVAAFFASI